MNIGNVQLTAPVPTQNRHIKTQPIIEPVDIKAILYLGLRGDVSLPEQEHKVDILT